MKRFCLAFSGVAAVVLLTVGAVRAQDVRRAPVTSTEPLCHPRRLVLELDPLTTREDISNKLRASGYPSPTAEPSKTGDAVQPLVYGTASSDVIRKDGELESGSGAPAPADATPSAEPVANSSVNSGVTFTSLNDDFYLVVEFASATQSADADVPCSVKTLECGQFMKTLNADGPTVAACLGDQRLDATVIPNDSEFGQLWGLHQGNNVDIDAPEAWDTQSGTKQIVVAVLDTGLDLSHPDLAARLWVNPLEIPNNNRDDDLNGRKDDVNGWNFVSGNKNVADNNGHGTHVAGTAAAIGNNALGVTGVLGLAPNISIMPVKVLNANNWGYYSWVIGGINYSTKIAQMHPVHMVLNISMGGAGVCSSAFRTAFNNARNAGIMVAVSAGNNNANTTTHPMQPADCTRFNDNVVGVASIDRHDNRSPFSNYGTRVTVAAPGSDILSTCQGGGYCWYNGTSMAAPHVAGTLGLMMRQCPGQTTAQYRTRIKTTSVPSSALTGVSESGGKINLRQALASCS